MRRDDFPILTRERDLVYLDSAASAQKPRQVIDAESAVYQEEYANVHRGVYDLSVRATERYEAAREKVATFLGNVSPHEVIFTRGTTEAINLVAYAWSRANLGPGDEILSTLLEHHSNFVPWQQMAKLHGAQIHFVGVNPDGTLNRAEFSARLSQHTKLVAITALANGTGLELPLTELIAEAHARGALVLVDAAQAIAHKPLDVRALNADFVCFSGHKLYGPSGIGVLYGRRALLEAMPPFQFGGDMIRSVAVEETLFNDLPYKFEAGTPHIAGAIALGAAIDYVNEIGLAAIERHEATLIAQLEEELAKMAGITVLGPRGQHTGLVSFVVEGVHPHDVAQHLNSQRIAVRAGHHCAQPLLRCFGLNATTRASVGVYNDHDDISRLAQGLRNVQKYFLK